MSGDETEQSLPPSERAALEDFLDVQRAGLLATIERLDDATARQTPTASSLSLLGIVKHATIWERRWFQVVMAGRESGEDWPTVRGHNDETFEVGEADTVEKWVGRYREQIDQSRAVVASMDLDGRSACPDWLGQFNLRFVLLHMIEETARHAGHADIIRETLDGSRAS